MSENNEPETSKAVADGIWLFLYQLAQFLAGVMLVILVLPVILANIEWVIGGMLFAVTAIAIATTTVNIFLYIKSTRWWRRLSYPVHKSTYEGQVVWRRGSSIYDLRYNLLGRINQRTGELVKPAKPVKLPWLARVRVRQRRHAD